MGIFDKTAEEARAEQAAAAAQGQQHVPLTGNPAVLKQIPAIDAATPTPAVGPGAIIADKIARKQLMEAVAADPSIMANSTVVEPLDTPQLIPIGTPSPVPNKNDIYRDKLARAEAALAFAQPGAPATVAPVAASGVPGVAPVEQKTEELAPVPEAQAPAVATAAMDPTLYDKMKYLAAQPPKSPKKGATLAERLQTALYNFSGVNRETNFERRTKQEAEAEKTAQNQAWQEKIVEIQNRYQSAMQERAAVLQKQLAVAKNQWDVEAAKTAYQQAAAQADLDRKHAVQMATINNANGFAVFADWLAKR